MKRPTPTPAFAAGEGVGTKTGIYSRSAILLSALLFLALLIGCGQSETTDGGPKYHCPMHPTYTSDRPGDCPICNMKLVAIKNGGTSSQSAEADGSKVPGRALIAISPEKRQTIGLTTVKVEKRNLSRSIHATAIVTHDETRFARIAPRFGGWVRKLHVNFTGQRVEKGEPLFTVYSPELLATENEYLLALRNFRQLSNSAPAQAESAKRLLDSAHRRLDLLGVGEEEIRALEERQQASDELLIRTPFTGHVVTKNAVEGKAFMAGDTLYEIADLSHLWLRAWVFEHELSAIQAGQNARVSVPSLGNRAFKSEVTFIYPHIDPQTRRGEARLELDNPDHALRPDMWANVEILVESNEVLSIPASAVIDTGRRQIAFVSREDEHLEPREIKIGAKTDDYYEVIEGLKEGEQVVTRALFLVDSESQLKAAVSGMSGE